MDIWKARPDKSYERSLGLVELGFYWDSIFARIADTIRCAEVKVASGQLEEIASLSNVTKAWANLKKRFPLLGGRLEECGNDVLVVIAEERLRTCQENEISICEASSWEDAVRLANDLLQTEQRLTSNLLARIIVAKHKERSDHFYFIFIISHVITDGISHMTIIKTFLDELCGLSFASDVHLDKQLMMSVAPEDLYPALKLNVARRRWRKAIASVLASRMFSKSKGGHGLPQKISQKTGFTPARSRHLATTLPSEISAQIINNCRKRGITFGNAYPIIGQVATARVLLRRYLRGEIDEVEWEFRKKEPMYSGGPINLRTYLDQDWQKAGGTGHLCVALAFYWFPISFLPLGSASKLRPGMPLPAVGDLLTRERLFFRAKSVQRRARAYQGSPLFLEIAEASFRQRRRVEIARETALKWRNKQVPHSVLSDRFVTPIEQATIGPVFCNGGSSLGNIDLLLPREYPSVQTNEDLPGIGKLQLGRVTSRLSCRPCELYLGALTLHNQLNLFIHFDANVFDEELMKEWLEEVRLALEFYLGEEIL